MEKVQFNLESTLPELKDLYEKSLFTRDELNKISKRRTAFESALVARNPSPVDYSRYAEYEINLERTRKIRYKRLGYDINPPPPSASSFSIPRRVVYILRRAAEKWPGDQVAWLEYAGYASRQRMNKVVEKALNGALHAHPLSPTFYCLLAYHYTHPQSPLPTSTPATATAAGTSEQSGFALEGIDRARKIFLLGLRLMPNSRDLWREYIKLELGWVELMRRRRGLLLIDDSGSGASGASAVEGEGEEFREILKGALVKIVIAQAAVAIRMEEIPKERLISTLKAGSGAGGGAGSLPGSGSGSTRMDTGDVEPTTLPGQQDALDFWMEMIDFLGTYPSHLRISILDEVYRHIPSIAGTLSAGNAVRGQIMVVTRRLNEVLYDPASGGEESGLKGEEYVTELARVAKEVKKLGTGGETDVPGRWLLQQAADVQDNEALRDYLYGLFKPLIAKRNHPTADLLILHLDFAQSTLHIPAPDLLSLARTHASIHPSNATIQRKRLDLEVELFPPSAGRAEELRQAAKEAIKAVSRRANLTLEDQVHLTNMYWTKLVWELKLVDVPPQVDDGVARTKEVDAIWDEALHDSLRQSVIPDLHSMLLGLCLAYRLRRASTNTDTDPLKTSNDLVKRWSPSHQFFLQAFSALSHLPGIGIEDLEKVYQLWKSSIASSSSARDSVQAQAALVWLGWLVRHGHGGAAAKAYKVARKEIGAGTGAGAQELDDGWEGVLALGRQADLAERGVEDVLVIPIEVALQRAGR